MAATDSSGDEAGLVGHLDDAERARAGRFVFERDRVRFVQCHAFVRRVLARYLDVAPAEVSIQVGPFGRPELDPLLGISFNVSRAGALTVVAVAQARSVGVDIERQRPIDEALGIAESMFSEPECELLRSVPPASRSHAFLALWTRKESLVKAVGGGLSLGLDWFDVSEQDDRGVGRPRGPRGAMPFTIGRLDAPPGYVGAVTLRGEHIGFRDMGLEAGDR